MRLKITLSVFLIGESFLDSLQAHYLSQLEHFLTTSGPIVVIVLSGDEAISKNRTLMGATDPAKAGEGTLRKDFAKSVTKNAVHGSDSKDSAAREIAFFFTPDDVVNP